MQAAILDDDDVEAEKEEALRRVCVAMRAYLRGTGGIEQRRRWFRRGTTNVLYLEVDGGRPWRLGRNFYSGRSQISHVLRSVRPASTAC